MCKVPVYIAEISPQNLRGRLGCVNQVNLLLHCFYLLHFIWNGFLNRISYSHLAFSYNRNNAGVCFGPFFTMESSCSFRWVLCVIVLVSNFSCILKLKRINCFVSKLAHYIIGKHLLWSTLFSFLNMTLLSGSCENDTTFSCSMCYALSARALEMISLLDMY